VLFRSIIDPDTQELTVLFEYATHQYTADGRYIKSDVTLQTHKQAFPFEVGDYVADPAHIERGIGLITADIKLNYGEPTYLTIKFNNENFNYPKPANLTLVKRGE
jgi:hypothetical protein